MCFQAWWRGATFGWCARLYTPAPSPHRLVQHYVPCTLVREARHWRMPPRTSPFHTGPSHHSPQPCVGCTHALTARARPFFLHRLAHANLPSELLPLHERHTSPGVPAGLRKQNTTAPQILDIVVINPAHIATHTRVNNTLVTARSRVVSLRHVTQLRLLVRVKPAAIRCDGARRRRCAYMHACLLACLHDQCIHHARGGKHRSFWSRQATLS